MFYNSIQLVLPINSNQDFIKTIHYHKEKDIFLFIYEQNKLQVVKNYSNLTHNYEITQNHQKAHTFRFQTVLYDARIVYNRIIASSRQMPVRLYPIDWQENADIDTIAIYDKKKHSEMFLSPLMFAVMDDIIIGGGKKFITQYDLHKYTVKNQIKAMDKNYTSSVQLMNRNLLVAGQFSGEIIYIDINSNMIISQFKPHMDLVTKIEKNPHCEHQFFSLGRKDNYCYLWDVRYSNTFVDFYNQNLYGNQRTGLFASAQQKKLYLGNEEGVISEIDYQKNERNNFDLKIKKCISSICEIQQGLVIAIGSRNFTFQDERDTRNELNVLKR